MTTEEEGMKVEMSEDGRLEIKAETSVESFALRCWKSFNDSLQKPDILVDPTMEEGNA